MPGWLTELLKLLGFTTPFVYAAATYGMFHWLDKKASGPAKTAMRGWIQSDAKIDTTNIIVGLFDRIYTYPLFRWQAFRRSAVITISLCCLFWMEQNLFFFWFGSVNNRLMVYLWIGFALMFNVLTDYVSLFAVRYWLLIVKGSPLISLFIGPAIGALIIFTAYHVRLTTNFVALVMIEMGNFSLDQIARRAVDFQLALKYVRQDPSLYPAFAVHLWLPLFGMATLIAQALTWLSKAAGWMQWFFKQGQHHPFQAVGFVASIIVFVSGVVVQYVWR